MDKKINKNVSLNVLSSLVFNEICASAYLGFQ